MDLKQWITHGSVFFNKTSQGLFYFNNTPYTDARDGTETVIPS
ncbi:MAG: hypothetical protein ACFFD4_33565 [Candidatus Odinarchaeota archaeon]